MIASQSDSKEEIHYQFKLQESESDIQYWFEQLADISVFSFDSKLNLQGTILLGKYFKLISHVTHLSFRLQSNNLGVAGMSGIASGFYYLKSLQHLTIHIEPNDIRAEGAVALFKEISQLTNLQSLSIHIGSQNDIGLIGSISLGYSITKLSNLMNLSIVIGQKNNITSEGVGHIANGITNQLNLKCLTFKVESGNSNESKSSSGSGIKISEITSSQHNTPMERMSFEQLGKVFTQLRNLVELNISFNDFKISESGIESFTTGLSSLSNLQKLSLEIILKSGTKAICFSTCIGNGLKRLVNLECLSIHISSLMSEQGAIELGEGIRQLTKLKSLVVQIGGYCYLNEESAHELFTRFDQLDHLEDLSITIDHLNQIKEKGGIGISTILAHSLKLKKFVLSIGRDNRLGVIGAQSIGSGIQKLLDIVDLQIKIGQFNNISQTGASNLLEGFNQLENLKNLSIKIDSDNNLDSHTISNLNNNIKSLRLLEFLDISIASPEVPNFNLDAFEKMGNLKQLDLVITPENKISKDKSIGKSLQHLTNLTSLSISIDWGNKLGVEGAEALGEAISNLVNLKSLKLYIGFENNITMKGGLAIANSFEQLVCLESIDLTIEQGNQLSDKVIRAIYLSLKKLQTLRKVKFNLKDPTYFYLIPLIEHNLEITEENFEIQEFAFQFNKVLSEDKSTLKEFSLVLPLNNVNITGSMGQYAAFEVLKDLPSITKLNLVIGTRVEFSTELASVLANSFKKLKRLTDLSIYIGGSYARFNDSHAKIFFPVLSNLSLLSKFSFIIGNNEMLRNGMTEFCNMLVKIKQIEVLQLRIEPQGSGYYGNKNNVQLTDILSKALQKLTNLKSFSYSVANFYNGSQMYLVTEACQNMLGLKHLKVVIPRIFVQNMVGIQIESLLSPFENLTNLTSIDLQLPLRCDGTDSIQTHLFPQLISKLKLLRYLKLTFVVISQFLSDEIKKLVILENKRLVELQILRSSLR